MSVHVPVPDVARFSSRGTLFGVDVETSMFLRRLSPPINQTDLDLVTLRVRDFWDGFFTPQLASDLVMREIFAEDLSPASTLTSLAPVIVPSGFQGPSLPASIAISFLLVGPTLPRSWQWLVRLFGVPESKVAGNTIDTTWADNLAFAITQRWALQGAFGWRWSAVSQVSGGVPRAVGVTYDVVSCRVGSYVVAPMRRRMR
jgi:hypothetical protein